jgi:hypothetical protein
VIISQAAEPDSSVLQEPLLGPSPLPNGGGVETPVPARSDNDPEEVADDEDGDEEVHTRLPILLHKCTHAHESSQAAEPDADDDDTEEIKDGDEEVHTRLPILLHKCTHAHESSQAAEPDADDDDTEVADDEEVHTRLLILSHKCTHTRACDNISGGRA